ncbi:RING-type domain-containing protein [Mycena sanguinolenta]|uniref:RING-type domain-containing protein n=1 Tax=Mycena sanguinolenta TaxID=230812 RepID=A0A8H6XRW3_9AGAR|nr:RING-type domain-containing protein [Mycena sanguinolenta]
MADTYDLLIVTDATASMEGYLDALRASIPEILALAKLSGAFSRLGVFAYKDHCDPADQIVAWSGWNAPTLPQFVSDLNATGGGDFPEAAKTALIRALQAANKDSKTLVLWYADAPPHHMSVQSYQNDVAEAKAFPKGAVDWVKLCHIARRRNCTLFCFTPRAMEVQFSCFYVLLAELTGGVCIGSKSGSTDSAHISRLTLGVIMQWMGRGTSTMNDVIRASNAVFLRYEKSPRTAVPKLTDEGLGSQGYLPPSHTAHKGTPSASNHQGSLGALEYPPESAYRDLVYESLTSIIRTNVACLSYNPVFGQLWRAVCKDADSRKTALVDLFSEYVSKVSNADEKAALRQWLEDSFDQTEAIEGIIKRHCANGPTQMVYLDFDADVHLTRTELLEVSRSCYAAVLKKIARVFTHLKLVEPGVTLASQQRSIPLTLPARDFYRLLPHLIVPGTLYPARAATLTAVISLITGVPFLKDSATALLATAKGKWLDLEVPENISFDCARFLLSAPEGVVLTARERRVYKAMRRYKLIELNLDAPIGVSGPWTPQKMRGPGDVKIQCTRCSVRRSVTIMSHQHANVCGLCLRGDLPPSTLKEKFPGVEEAESCWVECSSTNCRAQYVVENVPALKIRPRCYYCRNNAPCPWLECSVCTNRVIVPHRYRTDEKRYTCPGCSNANWGGKSIVTEDTTLRTLIRENGRAWLGFSDSAAILDGKSAFKLMQAFGAEVFGKAPTNAAPSLLLRQKVLHDTAKTLAQVEAWVGSGEVVLASCALCFEEMPTGKLVPACGRTGCAQLVDDGCLREWYGQNEPGKLLNMMQFTCPFCRRKPTVKTFARYNKRAAVLCGVQEAMGDRRFLYAWCIECGCAKQAFERTACTEEGVAPISGFKCEDCRRPRPGRVVNCPNVDCRYPISKSGGCNHITCVCGTHFCYACGGEFGFDIYDHMSRVHGSFYDPWD